jgi:hypothetical protein
VPFAAVDVTDAVVCRILRRVDDISLGRPRIPLTIRCTHEDVFARTTTLFHWNSSTAGGFEKPEPLGASPAVLTLFDNRRRAPQFWSREQCDRTFSVNWH